MKIWALIFIIILVCVLFFLAYFLRPNDVKGYYFTVIVAISSLIFGVFNTFRKELSEFVVTAKVNSVVFTSDGQKGSQGKRNAAFIIPMTLVNTGGRSGYLQSVALCIINKSNKQRLFLMPTVEIDYESFIQGKRHLHSSNIRSEFRGIWVGAGETIFKAICFTYSGDHYSINSGEYEFVLVGLYDDSRGVVELTRFEYQFDQSLLDSFVSGNTTVLSYSNWEKYEDSISKIVGGKVRTSNREN